MPANLSPSVKLIAKLARSLPEPGESRQLSGETAGETVASGRLPPFPLGKPCQLLAKVVLGPPRLGTGRASQPGWKWLMVYAFCESRAGAFCDPAELQPWTAAAACHPGPARPGAAAGRDHHRGR